MASQLIIHNQSRAANAKSFAELESNLNSDQVHALRRMFRAATGRDPGARLSNTTPGEWGNMANLIVELGAFVAKLNADLDNVDWAGDTVIRPILEQAERAAIGKSPEYQAVMRYVLDLIEDYRAFGKKTGSGVHELIEIRSVGVPQVLDQAPYDFFISFDPSRHATQAEELYRGLKGRYKVWFDEDVLRKKQSWLDVGEMEHLKSILTNAVQHSFCTIVFEIAKEAVLLLPGQTEEETLAGLMTMKDGDQLINWNWQIVEISVTKLGIAIHPQLVVAFQSDGTETLKTESFGYKKEAELLGSVEKAFKALKGPAFHR